MNPFFSVIIPTYNRANLIPKAIESILNQTFVDWELIIVDDGSCDETKAVVANYKDNRIKYIWQKNKERSAARNNGISNSKGEYICFLDSDDYFLPDRLQSFFIELSNRKFPIAIFYTGICFDTNGKIERREENPNIFGNMLEYVVYNPIGNPQVCIHKSILDKHKFNESISISEDVELWVRIIADGYEMTFLNYANVIVSEHLARSVSFAQGNTAEKMLPVLKLIFSKPHPGNIISKSLKKLLISTSYYNQAKYFIYHNKKWHAILMLLYAIFTQIKNQQTKHKCVLIYKLVFVRKSNCKKLLDLIGG